LFQATCRNDCKEEEEVTFPDAPICQQLRRKKRKSVFFPDP
jgi:hypothetical protein